MIKSKTLLKKIRYENERGRDVMCPVCGKEVFEWDAENLEHIKTQRGTDVFVHTKCVEKWGECRE